MTFCWNSEWILHLGKDEGLYQHSANICSDQTCSTFFRWGRNCWKGKIRQENLKGQEALPWGAICVTAFVYIICKSEIVRTWKFCSNRHPFSNIELGMISFANWTFEKIQSDKPNWRGLWNEERFVAVEKYYLKTQICKNLTAFPMRDNFMRGENEAWRPLPWWQLS